MLRDQIQNDIIDALKARAEDKLSTIRMLKSATQYFEIQKGGAGYEASDEDVIEVVGREIKKRRESIEMFEKGNRQELADKEKSEIITLQTYLPEQLSDNDVNKLIDNAFASTGASTMQDMGKVMEILSPQIKGKADGGMVSVLVREKISKLSP